MSKFGIDRPTIAAVNPNPRTVRLDLLDDLIERVDEIASGGIWVDGRILHLHTAEAIVNWLKNARADILESRKDA